MAAFDAVYHLAAKNGREEALFGNSIELARLVYETMLIGGGYPHAYVEFPLLGEPCFDLLSVHAEVGRGAVFEPGAGFGRQEIFDWSANVRDGETLSCDIAEATQRLFIVTHKWAYVSKCMPDSTI